MATLRTGTHGHFPHFTLNSDGRPHPILNTLAVGILLAGLAAFGIGVAIVNTARPGLGLAIPAAVLGLISLFIGLYGQMMSETREERVLLVTGIVFGFVGLALGLAHGALG